MNYQELPPILERMTFEEYIIDDFDPDSPYQNMEVLAAAERWLLGRDFRTNRAHYIYATDDNCEMLFDFDILAMVATVFQPVFEEMLVDAGVTVQLYDGDDGFYELLLTK